jgi:NAD(P)-dependent dehydrogenase (short-subunit alcohol dehydrogenase family)
MANKPTILIIGASRGLGLALVEQFCGRHWHVIATVRRKSAALDALKARFPASLEEETVDIADEASVRALRQRLDGRTTDMLFVNAGIAKSIAATPGTAPVQDFLDMMLVNAFCPVRLIEIFEDDQVLRNVKNLGLSTKVRWKCIASAMRYSTATNSDFALSHSISSFVATVMRDLPLPPPSHAREVRAVRSRRE